VSCEQEVNQFVELLELLQRVLLHVENIIENMRPQGLLDTHLRRWLLYCGKTPICVFF
jgi:hypothetical protein